jgi:peptide-methionine (S)-S-oxide reductase
MRLLLALAAVFMLDLAAARAQTSSHQVATFAGGCFWCTEADFDKVKGVISTTSGFMGGKTPNPSYQQVVAGGTGHAEVVQITFDPAIVTYKHLVDVYWRSVDPLDKGGQFCDRGDQYRTAIFYHDEAQKKVALDSKAALEAEGPLKGKKIVTEISPAATFTKAEDYHQDFYLKSPGRYLPYRAGCRRDARLKEVWGDQAGVK